VIASPGGTLTVEATHEHRARESRHRGQVNFDAASDSNGSDSALPVRQVLPCPPHELLYRVSFSSMASSTPCLATVGRSTI